MLVANGNYLNEKREDIFEASVARPFNPDSLAAQVEGFYSSTLPYFSDERATRLPKLIRAASDMRRRYISGNIVTLKDLIAIAAADIKYPGEDNNSTGSVLADMYPNQITRPSAINKNDRFPGPR